MRKLIGLAILLTSAAWAQLPLDANSIVVTATKTVVLEPTDATFMIGVSADISVPMSQVLAAVDFGLTTSDIIGISAYPMYPPYGGPVSASRVTYTLRLNVAISKVKDTIDKLDKLRKSTDSGIDLNYSTTGIGPNAAAINDAHDKSLPDLMADARKRAQAVASAAQMKLGAIQAVQESYYAPTVYSGPMQPIITFSATVRFAAQ